LAVEHRARGKKNVGPQNPIDLLFAANACGATFGPEVNRHHWLVDEIERTDPQRFGNANSIEGPINHQPRRQFRRARYWAQPVVLTTAGCDRAHGRTGVDAKHRSLTVDKYPNNEVILWRALERERLKLCADVAG